MSHVVLINPPNSNTVLTGVTCTVTRPEEHTDWSNFPSLGVLTLASAIADIPGITPVYLDGTVVPWPTILDYLATNAGDLLAVCVSALTATYEAGVALLAHVKNIRPEVCTIVGNDHLSALPHQCLTNHGDCIDYGFLGNEVVGPFRKLIADLHRGQLRSPDHYPGLVYRGHDGITTIAQRAEPVFTAPRYDLVDTVFSHSKHYEANFQARVAPRLSDLLGAQLRAGAPVELARGCIKFSRNDACSFCSIQFGGLWRNAVADAATAWQVLENAHRAGYDYLYLTADELPLTFGHLLRQMHQTRPSWWTSLSEQDRPVMVGYARADGLSNPHHAELLRRLGIRQLMIGVDAGAPTSLAAMNKPLAPIKNNNPAYRAERMFAHNLGALSTAREHGLFLKVGFVLGHIGMTPELLADNIASMRTLIDAGKDVIASLDVEILSPEPGSLDYRYLTDPDLADTAAHRLGLAIADTATRRGIADHWRPADVIDREQAMRDYTTAVMPGLTLDALAAARQQLRDYGKTSGITIGE